MQLESQARRLALHSLLTLTGIMTGILAGGHDAYAQGLADPLDRPALLARLAPQASLSAITRAGARLVALGERGIILLSDDNGKSWRQAPTPVSVSLTKLQFVDNKRGWAIGHAGVVLHSDDGGNTWIRQLDGRQVVRMVLAGAAAVLKDSAANADGDAARQRLKDAQRMAADGADKPWLDLYFSDAANGWLSGAYGLLFLTTDGGKTWQTALDRVDNPKGLHLYAIGANADALYLAGEQGFFARSSDGGKHFMRIPTPYAGTYFALQADQKGTLLLAGLRGNVYASDDRGQSWRKLDAPRPVSLNMITTLTDGRMVLVDQSGSLLQSRDGGHTLDPLSLTDPPGPPLTAITQAADGTLVAASFRGARRLNLTTAAPTTPAANATPAKP